MSQLGYIVTAIALMSHLGWVTALYLTANHLMTKGILFLIAAAIILRTGAHAFADLGGLARPMPFTFKPRQSPSWPCPDCLRSPGSVANGCC